MIISSAKFPPFHEQNDKTKKLRPIVFREKMEKDKEEKSTTKHSQIILAKNDVQSKIYLLAGHVAQAGGLLEVKSLRTAWTT